MAVSYELSRMDGATSGTTQSPEAPGPGEWIAQHMAPGADGHKQPPLKPKHVQSSLRQVETAKAAFESAVDTAIYVADAWIKTNESLTTEDLTARAKKQSVVRRLTEQRQQLKVVKSAIQRLPRLSPDPISGVRGTNGFVASSKLLRRQHGKLPLKVGLKHGQTP